MRTLDESLVRLGVAAAALILLGGCGSGSVGIGNVTATTRQVVSPPTGPGQTNSGASDSHPSAVGQMRGDLNAFLALWKNAGLFTAGRRFLDPSNQLTRASDGLTLLSGSVGTIQIVSWRSPTDFTAMVEFDMHFSGSAGAWGNGANTRFVTARRASKAGNFRYELATGP